MSKMLQKSLMGALIVAIAIPILVAGGIWIDGLITAVLFFSAYEIASVKDQKHHWFVTIFIFLGVGLMILLPTSYKLPFMGIYMLFLILIGLTDNHYDISLIAVIFFVSIVLVNGASSLRSIYTSGLGWPVVIMTAIACYVCDTGAYFFGSFMGKHKMIPSVSPNKTWEGAIGGYLTGAICTVVFGYLVCPDLSASFVWSIALILPAVAEIGDLAFSMIKRAYGIKDYGSLFPGHGGMLDRIDSYLFCLMIYGAIVAIFQGGFPL